MGSRSSRQLTTYRASKRTQLRRLPSEYSEYSKVLRKALEPSQVHRGGAVRRGYRTSGEFSMEGFGLGKVAGQLDPTQDFNLSGI